MPKRKTKHFAFVIDRVTVYVVHKILLRLNKFNPIALRKAKIVYNFGLSGCNRVKPK